MQYQEYDKEIMEKIRKQRLKKLSFLKYKINTISLFIIILAVMLLCVLFFIMPKKKISEAEQRELTQMPKLSVSTLWNGEFTSGLNLYYSDNFAFREQLVKTKFALEDLRGVRYDDVRIYDSANSSSQGSSGNNPSESSDKDSAKSPVSKDNILLLKNTNPVNPNSTTPAIDLDNPYYTDPDKHFDIFDKESINDQFSDYTNIDKSELEGEQRGALFVIGDTALEIFYGNEKVSKDYADVINAYADALGDSVKIYDLIVPNHFEYGLPEKYKGQIGRDQKPFMDIVKDNLNDSVTFVDIYDYMKEHYEKGEYLYFRTDHHWDGSRRIPRIRSVL